MQTSRLMMLSLVICSSSIYEYLAVSSAVLEYSSSFPSITIKNKGSSENPARGMSALHWASQQGNLELIRLLVIKGADVNLHDARGLTPLHYAVISGNRKTTSYLLNHGADPDMADKMGYTAMGYAISLNQNALVSILLKHGADLHAMSKDQLGLVHLAACHGNLGALLLLSREGLDINEQTLFGTTALHYAAAGGWEEIVSWLLAHGADCQRRDARGKSAYQYACETGNFALASMIRKAGYTENDTIMPLLAGDYLGQPLPGDSAELFAPCLVSTEALEQGISFSPSGDEMFFTRFISSHGQGRSVIMTSSRDGDRWQEPHQASFYDGNHDYRPFFSPAGDTLFFFSQPIDTAFGPSPHLMYVIKTEEGWSIPQPLKQQAYGLAGSCPSVSNRGNLFFSMNNGIYKAERKGNSFFEPEKLDGHINYLYCPSHPFIASDESFILFDASVSREGDADLYLSFRERNGGWTKAVRLDDRVNSRDDDHCPYVSPDGKFLFFTRGGNIYWISTNLFNEFKTLYYLQTDR